ncbi:unnamed protein product [Dibothriocephalus latus]|uniref:Uncharacterized protein n=1 Tax=Dibothriocephalus latus TaxID=60516 RepID=A0A3P7NAC4_DIBLA|nr:unnamed protein product [Dibothriocephalus latus]
MSAEPLDENLSPEADKSDDEDVQEYISSTIRFFENVKQVRRTPFELPETITLIECENGTKVYLVIDHTLPDIVLVELCRGRGHSMMMDEDEIKKQMKENSIFTFVKNQSRLARAKPQSVVGRPLIYAEPVDSPAINTEGSEAKEVLEASFH